MHYRNEYVLSSVYPLFANHAVALVILYTTGRDKEHQPALLAAYYLLAAQSAVTPTMLGWQAVNTAGHTKKASVGLPSHLARRGSWG